MKITVNNPSDHRFQGWISTTIPRAVKPTTTVGCGPVIHAVAGKDIGRKGCRLFLLVDLAPWQQVTCEDWQPTTPPPLPSIPPDFRQQLEPVEIDGAPLFLVSTEVDGPLVRTLWRGRQHSNHLPHYELHIDYLLGVAWAEGEVHALASNIANILDREAGLGGIVRVGQGIVRLRSGKTATLPDLTAGRDQGMAIQPVALYFPGMGFGGTLESAMAWDQGPPQAICHDWQAHLGPVGVEPPGAPVGSWVAQHRPGALARLRGWEAGPLGVAANSGDTGAQEDQGYAFTEPFQPGGVAATYVRYLVACGMARRPCHYRERDGKALALEGHPRLVMWDSRPHWHLGISPDQLGNPGGRIPWMGWYGADREHWFCQSLAGAAALTGSPALQRLLEDQARVFLFMQTIKPGLSTSHAGAPRGIGWTSLTAAWLYESLDDRTLAELVKDRFERRVKDIIKPMVDRLTGTVKPWKATTQNGGEIWQTNGLHWVPWEHGIAALGLACAEATFGWPELKALALAAAEVVLLHGFTDSGSRWQSWDKVAVLSGGDALDPSLYAAGSGWAHTSGWFQRWAGAAAPVALRLGHPDAEVMRRAREIEMQVFPEPDKWAIPRT